MDFLHQFLSAPIEFFKNYGGPFVIVLSVLVFVHEWGHYIIARLCGVRVEKFSIGFGPELFGRTDKNGTRWKLSLIPLGGYVQMFGDTDPASAQHKDKVGDGEAARPMTASEKKVAFFTQPVSRRAAIVFAGPAVNYIFAFALLTGLYIAQGQPYSPPVAAKVIEGSVADRAGIKPDDKIMTIDGKEINSFQDIKKTVMVNLDREIEVEFVRYVGKNKWSSKVRKVKMTPQRVVDTDRFGFKHETGRIGIKSAENAIEIKEHTVGSAVVAAAKETYGITADTLSSIGQMIVGVRSADELGGILRIGAYAGEFAQRGFVSLVVFAALLSVNLGLVNLLPIPMLDGGHLTMYAMEKLRGKPLNDQVQEYAFRIGMAFLLGIMIFATWNDLVQLKVIDYVVKLIT